MRHSAESTHFREFLSEFATICKIILTCWSVTQVGLIHEKNRGSKISCDCPFNITRINFPYPLLLWWSQYLQEPVKKYLYTYKNRQNYSMISFLWSESTLIVIIFEKKIIFCKPIPETFIMDLLNHIVTLMDNKRIVYTIGSCLLKLFKV
jgi:hypothetical protein